MSVKLKERRSPPGKPLHDESLASEEASPQLFLEKDRQLHSCLRRQESRLLHDDLSSRTDLICLDLPRETGCKCDQAVSSLSCVAVLKKRLPCKHPSD